MCDIRTHYNWIQHGIYASESLSEFSYHGRKKPKLGLWVTVAAGVTNMVLDALFVGVFKWGVAGAAIATGLSQCVGGLLPFIYFLRPNNSLLRFVKTKIEFRPVIDASANGASELVSNVTASIVGMLYNYQLLKYAGEDGVAAYGTLMYVEFIFIAVFLSGTRSEVHR